MSRLTVLDAPSNLGLRPPAPGVIPGCHRAPATLRACGLLDGLEARDAGVLEAPPYDPAWAPGSGSRNADAVAAYSRDLAARLEPLLDDFCVVLGGDCSILLGEMLALRQRGRHGLAFIDGHGDFRHAGNGEPEAAAGEDLAIVTGRGDHRLIDLDGRGPTVRDADVVVLGPRADDLFLEELGALRMPVLTSDRIQASGPEAAAARALAHLRRPELEGFWVHLDVDVLDGALLPAVDSPEPGGLAYEELTQLLVALCADPGAVGLDVCIYDPDLDPDLEHGRALASALDAMLRTVATRR